MLHRKHAEGTVVIAQPAHGVLVGTVARAWGREPFAVPPCMPESLLAAEQHEIGMATWELAPTFNPATGLPHAYTELTLQDHLRLWPDAAPLMWTQSRYAALLDAERVGFAVRVKVDVRLASQTRSGIDAFSKAIMAMPEVIECMILFGEWDYC